MRVDSRSGKCGFMFFLRSLVRDAETEIWRCLIENRSNYCFRINRTASRYYMNVLGLFHILIRIAWVRNGQAASLSQVTVKGIPVYECLTLEI